LSQIIASRKTHAKVISFRIIGITLEVNLVLGSARIGVTFKGFSIAPFFMQVVSVSQNNSL